MPYTVIVDSREYRVAEDVVKHLRRLGVVVVEKMLDVGDYVVSERVIIERKKANDFASSIVDGRLFEQAKKLADACSKPVIIVEGSLWSVPKYRNIHLHALLGALTTLALKFGITILFSRDAETTAFYIYELAKLEQEKEKKGVKTVHVRKTQSIRELQIQLLASLPGIGPKRAEKILQEFKTPLEALNNFKLWTRVGVPESVIALIRKILTTEFTEAENESAEQEQLTIDKLVQEDLAQAVQASGQRVESVGILKFFESSKEQRSQEGQRSNPSSS